MKLKSLFAIPGLLSLLVLSSSSTVFGGTLTWDGQFPNNANWSQKQNWGNQNSIATGDDLVFAGIAQLTTNNDTAATTSYNSITFSSTAGAFVLNGNSITLGAGVSGSSITNNSSSLQTINLDLILSGNRTITSAAGSITIGGVISGTSFGITKLGTQNLTLSNANTYTGLTTVSAGTLAYGITNAISTGAVTVDGSSAILSLGAFNDSVGTVTVANGGSITGSGTLTSTGSFAMQSGSVSAKLGGTGIALNKTTGGTVTLSGANTYTGTTTVNGGKLTVGSTGVINFTVGVSISGGEFNYNNTTTALSQPVTFALSSTGGTLSGSGSITQGVSVSSGNTYSAGAKGDPGTQAFTGGLALASGSIFSWDLDAAATDPGANTPNSGSYDIVTGNGSGTGTFNVVLGLNHFTDVFWNTPKSWNNIFSGSDPTFSLFSGTDGVSSVASNGLVSGQGQFTYTGSTLSWAPVPEPTSALAGILLGAGLLRRKRGQRQSV